MQASRSARGLASVLGLVALFVLGFLATATLLRSALVLPLGLQGGAKLESFRQDRDEIDLIYLGSSYVAQGIDPSVIDAIVGRELERPVRSFNLGMAGAGGLEVDYLIRSLLSVPPARLRWVVIEAPTFDGRIPENSRNLSRRSAYWHTARQTLIALEQLAVADASAAQTREFALLHLRLFGIRATNLGLGEELFRSLTQLRPPGYQRTIEQGRANQGFASFEALEGFFSLAQRRRKFLERPQDYIHALRRFLPDATGPEDEHYPVSVLDAQARFLESRGITPIYVVPPTLNPAGGFSELARQGRIRHLLVYADPKRYPELYRLSSRWDDHHTSEQGTLLWNRLLAHDLARLIRGIEAGP